MKNIVLLGERCLVEEFYSPEEIPHQWKNEVPLLYNHTHIAHSHIPFINPEIHGHFITGNIVNTTQFPVERFPLIEDFEVILWTGLSNWDKDESQLVYEVSFFSPSRGFLAALRSWDYTPKELSQDSFEIPIGDFQMPYYDFDQGWAILIAEHDAFIYILQGSFEEVFDKKGYYTWFKVEKERYYSQWKRAIVLCRDFCGR